MAPLDRRQFCQTLGAAAVGSVAGCLGFLGSSSTLDAAPGDDWPMHGYDATNSGHHPETSGPDGPVSAQWTRDVGSRVAPAVRDGLVYHTDESGGLAAFDPTDGSAEWRYDTADAVNAAIAAVDGAVYATDSGDSGNATLSAVDAASGEELWTHEFDGARGMAPVVADVSGGTGSSSPDRIVVAGSREGHVAAFDAETGDRQWRSLPPTASTSVGASFSSSPAVGDDTVYVAGDGGHVYALDASDGSERWTTEVSSEYDVTTSPTVADGTVYVGTQHKRVFALDAASGERQWKSERLEPIAGTAIADGTLFVTGRATLYALDAATGQLAWEGEPHGSYRYARPIVVDGVVYVAGESCTLLAYDAESGDLAWAFEPDARPDATPAAPVAVDGVAVVTGPTGFYALTSE